MGCTTHLCGVNVEWRCIFFDGDPSIYQLLRDGCQVGQVHRQSLVWISKTNGHEGVHDTLALAQRAVERVLGITTETLR